MKKFYSFTILSIAILFSFNGASAQSYSATYTAVRSGSWHVTSGPGVWDLSGEPSSTCHNCKIVINAGVSVTLNAHVQLDQSSTMIIGSASTDAAVLTIAGSSGTDWNSSDNVILLNDNINPISTIVLASTSSLINGAGGSSVYDGIFTAVYVDPANPTTSAINYYKQIGKGASGFTGTTITNHASLPASSQTLSGVVTLSANGALPILLSEFDATLNGKEVDLIWTTDMELNAAYFDIQRSVAGGNWEAIGRVAAKGNSSTVSHYAFTDANPASGTSEYRLQSVDLDGKSTYSEIRVVRNGLIGSVSIFPNPAKDYVNITLGNSGDAAGTFSVRLISQSGQLLVDRKVTNAGGTTITIPVSSYPQGNYLIQVAGADGAQQVSKVLISRQ